MKGDFLWQSCVLKVSVILKRRRKEKKRKEKKKRGIVILIGRNAYHTDIVNVLILNDYCHDMLEKERTKERKKERKDKRDKTMKKRNNI